jgi:hypothetical protein
MSEDPAVEAQLFAAAREGDLGRLEELLDNGAPAYSQDDATGR